MKATATVDAPQVLREQRGPVATVSMNRGERFNPLSSAMIAALQRELDAIAADRAVRVVVLKGEGRGFCAGHDLKELRAHPDKEWHNQLFRDCSRMMMTLTRMPQPVIARVHGLATAAGCQLVSMCDLAVAAEEARFALPGVNIGVFCSTPAVGVARNVSRKRTMDMLLTGEWIDAATALDWGLVNRAVPADRLDAEIERYCTVIAARSAAVVALGKQSFYRQIEQGLEGAYAQMNETMVCNLQYDDAAEGVDAFLGKRSAVWKDR
jgi:enoyl-CoA hydratase/carnithine racemase